MKRLQIQKTQEPLGTLFINLTEKKKRWWGDGTSHTPCLTPCSTGINQLIYKSFKTSLIRCIQFYLSSQIWKSVLISAWVVPQKNCKQMSWCYYGISPWAQQISNEECMILAQSRWAPTCLPSSPSLTRESLEDAKYVAVTVLHWLLYAHIVNQKSSDCFGKQANTAFNFVKYYANSSFWSWSGRPMCICLSSGVRAKQIWLTLHYCLLSFLLLFTLTFERNLTTEKLDLQMD